MPVYNYWISSYNLFKKFSGSSVSCIDITENYCNRYLQYLKTTITNRGKCLDNSSINHYFSKFSSVVKDAVRDKLISANPLDKIKYLKVKSSEPIYLTFSELQSLVNTDCKHLELKRAFIFSCLSIYFAIKTPTPHKQL